MVLYSINYTSITSNWRYVVIDSRKHLMSLYINKPPFLYYNIISSIFYDNSKQPIFNFSNPLVLNRCNQPASRSD